MLGDSLTTIPEFLTKGWGGYVGAVLVGLPMYICATSSTPLAAALLAVGFSPGAILVFLLVGPATNLASMTVVLKLLQKKSLMIYLTTIVIVALCCGILTDFIYSYFSYNPMYQNGEHHQIFSILSHSSAILLLGFIFYFMLISLKKRIAKF